MWPFNCKDCYEKEENINKLRNELAFKWKENISLFGLSKLKWNHLSEAPSLKTNLLVANKDFTYFGFMYMEDGWDYSRKINMQSKGTIWATYTNPDSIAWWLNLDEIKK